MSAPAVRFAPALFSACFAAAVVLAPAVSDANEPSQAAPATQSWTDTQVAEHASRLAGPRTVAVVHFERAACKSADYAASWFDRFEKQLAGEALQEFGVEEAVTVVDVGSFGRTATRTIVRMKDGYRDSATCEQDLRALFAPLGEHVTFHERTLHIAPHERNVSAETRAALDAGCIAKRLEAVGPAPLRIVTVEPQKNDEAFVSLPETAASTSSAGTCLALAFDYRSSTGTLHIVSDGPAMELRIDEKNGRAPTLRAFARMARVLSDRFLMTSVAVPEAEAPPAEEITEIALPPFGLPTAR
ncbi:MAG TPA: hypothetical protein VGN57_22035 [Pirellulaceae bacterium]|jgi:hypothetical protein|nr:hypothetical protein [Pirellulaceae bacterium]